MADINNLNSFNIDEINKNEGEDIASSKDNNFYTVDSTKKILKDLSFPNDFIEEYSLLFFEKKIYLKFNECSNFFIMSYFKNKNQKKLLYDKSIKHISIDELVDILFKSKFFEQFPKIILKTSILISSLEEESPLNITDIIKIKEIVLDLNKNQNIVFDNWQKNSGVLSDDDNNIFKILEYKDDLNLNNINLYTQKKIKQENEKKINNLTEKENFSEFYKSEVFDYIKKEKKIKEKTEIRVKNHIEEEKITHYRHFIAGALSGILSRIITAPLERLKILYQVNYAGSTLKPPNILRGLQQIYIKDGFLGLFRGNLVNILKSTPDNAIKLYVFEKTKYFLDVKKSINEKNKFSTLKLLICGGISGVVANSCVFPLDVIKTRITASPNGTYSGIIDTVRKLYIEGGIKIFYKGLQASLCAALPNSGLNLTAYETLKRIFSGSSSKDNAKLLTTPVLMFTGGMSALFSSTILYPFQTLQSRIIMGKLLPNQNYNTNNNKFCTDLIQENNLGLIKLAKITFEREGLKGFYKGYCPGISKIIIGNAIGFSLYENIKHLMDN